MQLFHLSPDLFVKKRPSLLLTLLLYGNCFANSVLHRLCKILQHSGWLNVFCDKFSSPYSSLTATMDRSASEGRRQTEFSRYPCTHSATTAAITMQWLRVEYRRDERACETLLARCPRSAMFTTGARSRDGAPRHIGPQRPNTTAPAGASTTTRDAQPSRAVREPCSQHVN